MGEVTFLTTTEVAARLHVSRATVARWVREGYLPAARMPGKRGRLRFSITVVEAFEAGHTPDPEAEAS